MSDDFYKMVAVAITALCQVYAYHQSSTYSPLAWLYDFIARLAGVIAYYSGRIAIHARLAYMEVVSA